MCHHIFYHLVRRHPLVANLINIVNRALYAFRLKYKSLNSFQEVISSVYRRLIRVHLLFFNCSLLLLLRVFSLCLLNDFSFHLFFSSFFLIFHEKRSEKAFRSFSTKIKCEKNTPTRRTQHRARTRVWTRVPALILPRVVRIYTPVF